MKVQVGLVGRGNGIVTIGRQYSIAVGLWQGIRVMHPQEIACLEAIRAGFQQDLADPATRTTLRHQLNRLKYWTTLATELRQALAG